MTRLTERALILTLSISQWSGFRHDRDVTKEAIEENKAQDDAGRFNKRLLDKTALAGIVKVVSETRSGFITRTSPWLNDGSRILNSANYLDVSAWFRDQRDKFQDEVKKFLANYETSIEESKARLGDMFKAEDYPSREAIVDSFYMSMSVMPVQDKDDFRIEPGTISEEEIAQIRADIEASVKSAADATVKDAFERITAVAERMVDRMTAYKPGGPGKKAEGTFTYTITQNAKDLADILPGLNITADPRIDAMIDKLNEMAAEDVDVLRNNQSARDHAAKTAQDILDTIGAYLA